MTYQVLLRPAARRDWKKLSHLIRPRIERVLLALKENPRPHGVVKLWVHATTGALEQAITALSIKLTMPRERSRYFASSTGETLTGRRRSHSLPDMRFPHADF